MKTKTENNTTVSATCADKAEFRASRNDFHEIATAAMLEAISNQNRAAKLEIGCAGDILNFAWESAGGCRGTYLCTLDEDYNLDLSGIVSGFGDEGCAESARDLDIYARYAEFLEQEDDAERALRLAIEEAGKEVEFATDWFKNYGMYSEVVDDLARELSEEYERRCVANGR